MRRRIRRRRQRRGRSCPSPDRPLLLRGSLFFLEEEEEEEEEKISSHCFSLGVWVLPEENHISWFYSGCMFMPRSWRPFWTGSTQLYVKVVLALYVLGNLDFLRATGIWYPVRCRSRRRSTGKFEVFWETTMRNYFCGPLHLAVTGAVLFLLLA